MANPRQSKSLLRAASDAIPKTLKPPVAVGLNLAISSLLTYLAAPYIASDLAAVSRPFTNLSDYTGLLAIKSLTTLFFWLGNWDPHQAASLNILSLAPSLHYLHTYQPSHSSLFPTLATVTAIELFATYLPFKFLRPAAHKARGSTDSTRAFTALLVGSLYQLALYIGSNHFLTTRLLGAGWELESTARAHVAPEAVIFAKGVMMLPVGYAAADVIFFSEDKMEFGKKDGEVLRGVVGMVKGAWRRLGVRNRGIVKRTLVVATAQAMGVVQNAGAVKGGNVEGAAAMAAVWSAATVVVGAVLAWVGSVDV